MYYVPKIMKIDWQSTVIPIIKRVSLFIVHSVDFILIIIIIIMLTSIPDVF